MRIISPVNFINAFKNYSFKKEINAKSDIQNPIKSGYSDYANAVSNLNKGLINFTGRRRKPAPEKMFVLGLVDEGKNEREISEITGYSPETIRQYLLRWGVKLKRSFADKNKERIIELMSEGKSVKEIVDIMGCSTKTIYKAQEKWGLKGKGNIEKNKDEIIRLYQEGLSQQKIADIIGCSQTSVGKALIRWGCQRPFVSKSEENKDLIIALYEDGKNQKEIADILYLSAPTVHKYLTKWGVSLRPKNTIEVSKEKVVELFEAGKSYSEIAEELGTYATSIKSALIRWGMVEDDTKPRTMCRPELYKDKIIELHNSGKTQKEIAQITGCTPPAISNSLRLWGFASNYERKNTTKIADKNKELIIQLYNEGKNMSEIASIIGCHYTTIGLALRNWGIEPETIASKANVDKIMELRQAGKTIKEIASIMKCSHSSIDRVIRIQKKDENSNQ